MLNILLAELFLLAAASKLYKLVRPPSRIALFSSLPSRSSGLKTAIAVGLILAEVLVAGGALIGSRTILVSAVVLVVFYTLFGISVSRRSESCHCFAGLLEFGGTLPALVVRNSVIVGIAVVLAWRPVDTSQGWLEPFVGATIVLAFALIADHIVRPLTQTIQKDDRFAKSSSFGLRGMK